MLKDIPVSSLVKDTIEDVEQQADDNTEYNDLLSSDVQMFVKARHRFTPSTTHITNVLTGLSSKHSESAREIIQDLIRTYGEDDFYKAVHVIVADQEFMPTVAHEFFSQLGSDDELPIIPALAIGHEYHTSSQAPKGVSFGILGYLKFCIATCYDTLMKAEGKPYSIVGFYCNHIAPRAGNTLYGSSRAYFEQ